MYIEPPTAKPREAQPQGEIRPKIIISGAGLGGLMLGIVLQKMNIPFEIFERAKVVKPLGSDLSLNWGILPVFEQLGLLDELKTRSKLVPGINVMDSNLKEVAFLSSKNHLAFAGYSPVVFARSDLYDVLLAQIPPEQLHLGKKVVSFEQNKEGVMIRCQDHSTHHGDILVGADGAYSGVRQWLYKKLKDEKKLPNCDKDNFTVGYLVLVGVTGPMDMNKYPTLKDDESHFQRIVGGNNVSAFVVTATEGRFCWGCAVQLQSKEEAEEMMFKHSQWSVEHNDAMIEQFKDFPNGCGGTMSEFFDATPKEGISKVFLEEKMFETWYHERTVLIGDACHKMLPAAGQGAVNAMQDAVILANCINDIEEVTMPNIKVALASYREQRYPRAKHQFNQSRFLAKLVAGQKFSERWLRDIMFNYLPEWVLDKAATKTAGYKPQITCLPLATHRGSVPAEAQVPSTRYVAAKAKAAEEETARTKTEVNAKTAAV